MYVTPANSVDQWHEWIVSVCAWVCNYISFFEKGSKSFEKCMHVQKDKTDILLKAIKDFKTIQSQ